MARRLKKLNSVASPRVAETAGEVVTWREGKWNPRRLLSFFTCRGVDFFLRRVARRMLKLYFLVFVPCVSRRRSSPSPHGAEDNFICFSCLFGLFVCHQRSCVLVHSLEVIRNYGMSHNALARHATVCVIMVSTPLSDILPINL